MSVPYATASSGAAARDDITKILRRFGCESVGFMDDFYDHSLLLAFKHRGRQMQLRACAKGWAALYLRENPWSHRRSGNEHDYKQKVLRQGLIAVNSILRDWVKGQVMAIETGILSFEAVFMPYMMTDNGQPLIERIGSAGLLPSPPQDKP